jgi:hypothetical protein
MSTAAATTKFRLVNDQAREELKKEVETMGRDELVEMLKGYLDSYDERNMFIIESGLYREFKEHSQRFGG